MRTGFRTVTHVNPANCTKISALHHRPPFKGIGGIVVALRRRMASGDMAQRSVFGAGMLGNALRDGQKYLLPFGLHHAAIAATDAAGGVAS